MKRAYLPVYGSRVRPLRNLSQWACPRCGIDVNGDGSHLIRFAPCADCREILAAEGDTTIYDKRQLSAERVTA